MSTAFDGGFTGNGSQTGLQSECLFVICHANSNRELDTSSRGLMMHYLLPCSFASFQVASLCHFLIHETCKMARSLPNTRATE